MKKITAIVWILPLLQCNTTGLDQILNAWTHVLQNNVWKISCPRYSRPSETSWERFRWQWTHLLHFRFCSFQQQICVLDFRSTLPPSRKILAHLFAELKMLHAGCRLSSLSVASTSSFERETRGTTTWLLANEVRSHRMFWDRNPLWSQKSFNVDAVEYVPNEAWWNSCWYVCFWFLCLSKK